MQSAETAAWVPACRVVARGQVDYRDALDEMQAFCRDRSAVTPDEIWWLEHPPVYTLGVAGRRHVHRNRGNIPVINTDRGGETTYHGPGQLVVYLLLDLKRLGWRMRQLITVIEDSVVAAARPIQGQRDARAPGVFVGARKLASIGLRLQRGLTSHGVALNVANDLSPFGDIDPCGQAGLQMTSLAREGEMRSMEAIAGALIGALTARLGWSESGNGQGGTNVS